MSIFELTKKLYNVNVRMEIGIDNVTHDRIEVRFRKDICGKVYCMNAIIQNVNNEEFFTYELMYYLEKFLNDYPSEEV